MTKKFYIFSLGLFIALVLSACNLFASETALPEMNAQPTPMPTLAPTLGLGVSADRVGQTINYSYLIGNAGGLPIPGPIVVTDDKTATTCPEVTTVGNLDNNLEADEMLLCTGTYAITQADQDAGSVTSVASASAAGNISSPVTTTVNLQPTTALTLSKTANPQTYNSLGQTIVYTYVITNTGSENLGPAQFTINDDKIGAAINCGAGDTILAPTETVTCNANYLITNADLTAGTVVNTASATNGTNVSALVTATINFSSDNSNPPPGNLTPGSTIQHQVVKGEWLWQIARCYGADPRQVILANPQLSKPAYIEPGIIVSVPNIGSDGRGIHGPPCVGTHTVQSGETWSSIAQLYNVDPHILEKANPGALTVGRVLKVPFNSVGGK